MKVIVDFSDVVALEREAERSLDRAPRVMQRILEGKAEEERKGHAYRNRTGDLEDSTRATEIIEVGDQHLVQLEATMDYAEHVNRRGLMRIDELAGEAELEIEYFLDGEAQRLGGL